MIKYKSTRGSDKRLTAAGAIIAGIAEDKGLYVPETIPVLPMNIEKMKGMPYKEVAYNIIKSFFDDFTDDEMRACVNGRLRRKIRSRRCCSRCKSGRRTFPRALSRKNGGVQGYGAFDPAVPSHNCGQERE